jgi:ubiquinone/menaquinone biosynthesis C-methylase UbiE
VESALYDLIYDALARSRVYRKVVSVTAKGLPDWVIPLSHVDAAGLEHVAASLRLDAESTLLDMACGLGGAGLWIAQQTGAKLTGVDYSAAATAAARAIAAAQHLAQAQFITADATATGLPDHAYDAVMCIDSIQFLEPAKACAEIARLLRRGGRATVTTWESIMDPLPLPTMVRDYTTYFREAGLVVVQRRVDRNAREREMRYFRELAAHANELRAEIGEAAEPLLHEAEDRIARSHDAARVRKVFIVAQAR